ncbi:MAG: DUF6732 family protein [Rhizobiaceae bacterium]
MSKSIFTGTAIALLINMSSIAHAHLGHLGELAGHSHWVGLAAIATAAALAKLALRPRSEESEAEADSEPEHESGEETTS